MVVSPRRHHCHLRCYGSHPFLIVIKHGHNHLSHDCHHSCYRHHSQSHPSHHHTLSHHFAQHHHHPSFQKHHHHIVNLTTVTNHHHRHHSHHHCIDLLWIITQTPGIDAHLSSLLAVHHQPCHWSQ